MTKILCMSSSLFFIRILKQPSCKGEAGNKVADDTTKKQLVCKVVGKELLDPWTGGSRTMVTVIHSLYVLFH